MIINFENITASGSNYVTSSITKIIDSSSLGVRNIQFSFTQSAQSGAQLHTWDAKLYINNTLIATSSSNVTQSLPIFPNTASYLATFNNINLAYNDNISIVKTDYYSNLPLLFGVGFQENDTYNTVTHLVQSDGKILTFPGNPWYYSGSNNSAPFVNNSRYILRLTQTGSIDTSFNTGIGFNESVYAATQLSNGKLLIGGSFTEYSGSTANGLVMINDNGTIDTSLNVGTGIGIGAGLPWINKILVQSDGKILIGGNFTSYSGSTLNRIARLNTNGTIDTSFNIGTGFNNEVWDMLISGSGIFVAGKFSAYSGSSNPWGGLIKLDMSGSKDTGFNAFLDVGIGNVISIATQSNGKILAVGSYIGRTSGSIGVTDPTFTPVNFSGPNTSVKVFSDDKFLFTGDYSVLNGVGYDASGSIQKFLKDGAVDSSFTGNNTIRKVNTGAGAFRWATSTILPNDDIIVTGFFSGYSGSITTSGSVYPSRVASIFKANNSGSIITTQN